MAHIGKRWKLAFDRHLTLNLGNNVNSFGDGYTVITPTYLDPLGVALSVQTFHLNSPVKTNGDILTWESNSIVAAGFTAFVQLVMQIEHTPPVNVMYFRVRESALGIVYEHTNSTDQFVKTERGLFTYFGNPPTIETPGVIRHGPGTAVEDYRVVKWH